MRRAAELNQNPIVLPGTFHPNGRLPLAASYLSVDAENIQVTVLKQAEDNDDLILRAYETNRTAVRASAEAGSLWTDDPGRFRAGGDQDLPDPARPGQGGRRDGLAGMDQMTGIPSEISLGGPGWQFKGYLGEDWLLRRAFDPQTRDRLGWLPAVVPGSVMNDLWEQGEIPNPYFERNSRLAEWVPERCWVYKRSFLADSTLRGKRVELRFEGVDYTAWFYLNGELLGCHTGMFAPVVFEVGDRLRFGEENWVAVAIEPAPREQPQVGRTSLVRTHKTRMNYGWDFCPRLVHQGIWQDVRLRVTGPARLEDVWIRPQLAPDLEKAEILVIAQVSVPEAAAVRVEVDLKLDGRIAAQSSMDLGLPGGQSEHRLTLEVNSPALWWPNGYGPQPLYEADVRVYGASSENTDLSDRRTIPFGIRKIDFRPNEGASPAARPYTLWVNGRRTYIKGWNWVPVDVLYGVDRPDRHERLLELARRAGVNLLRVWGGGLIETEAFYRLCDRHGILVWQEFIQSSSGMDNCPADDPEFVDWMEAEARQIVPLRRNHPSLAIWCGGNELQAGPDQPLDETHPLLARLGSVVRALDPDRHWLPTSPTGPCFSNSLANIERDPGRLHDVHGPWEHQGLAGHPDLYNRGCSLLHSEFGVEGITNRRTLDAIISPERQWPASLSNPVWFHLGAWWVKERDWQAIFGEVGDLDTLVRAIQFSQADGLRYAVEADRRRKYRNSGTLPWQFNESYPMAACTSAVDYFTRPKPAYYAVAHAYEPVHVSAKYARQAWAGESHFEAEIWCSNSLRADIDHLELTARLRDGTGRSYSPLRQAVQVRADASQRLALYRCPLEGLEGEIFFLDLDLTD